MCLSRRDVEMAVELMAFPCGGYDDNANKFDSETDEEEVTETEEEEGVQEEEALNEEMEQELAHVLTVDSSLPDFSCFSQAWGTFFVCVTFRGIDFLDLSFCALCVNLLFHCHIAQTNTRSNAIQIYICIVLDRRRRH